MTGQNEGNLDDKVCKLTNGKSLPPNVRQISLVKGGERYIFRYTIGNEPEIIDAFIRLAEDLKSSFNWFDAAVLAYHMGKQLKITHGENYKG